MSDCCAHKTAEEVRSTEEAREAALASKLAEIEISKLRTMEQLLAEAEEENEARRSALILLGEAEKAAKFAKLQPRTEDAAAIKNETSTAATMLKLGDDPKAGVAAAPTSGNPISKQVGGSHYKDQAIQPVEFVYRNKLNFLEGSAVKYICRHRLKNGKEDLEKAIHYLQMLVELEYTKDD